MILGGNVGQEMLDLSLSGDGESGSVKRFGLASNTYYPDEDEEEEGPGAWLHAGQAGRRIQRLRSPPPTTCDSKPEWRWNRKVDLLEKPLGPPVAYLPSFTRPPSHRYKRRVLHTSPPAGGSPLYKVAGIESYMNKAEAARAMNKNKTVDQYVELGFTKGQHSVVVCDAHGLCPGAWNGSTVGTTQDVITSKKEQLLSSRIIRHKPGVYPKGAYKTPYDRFSNLVKKKTVTVG